MRVGIIGAGAIATYLLEEEKNHPYDVVSVFVRDIEKYAHLESEYDVTLYDDVTTFLQSPIDMVIEAATVEVVKDHLLEILQVKDAMIISIGALVDDVFVEKAQAIAAANKHQLYLPSGAIGGLDLVKNVLVTNTVEEVTLTTRKPAHTLVEGGRIADEEIIFDGSAKSAIAKYPRNMNVSITLSLAGIGFERTRVKLIADPKIEKNIHVINIVGAFGEADFTIANNPLPTNPHSSYLAAISIIGTLTSVHHTIKIG